MPAVEAALAESSARRRPAAPRAPTRPHVGRAGRRRTGGLAGLAGDLRFALRQLRRAPSFAAVAIATLGLGAGAATAIFSVVDAVLLQPLPYRAPRALVAIWETNAEPRPCRKERLSPVNFMDYRALHADLRRRRRVVAARDQPVSAGQRAGARQHD